MHLFPPPRFNHDSLAPSRLRAPAAAYNGHVKGESHLLPGFLMFNETCPKAKCQHAHLRTKGSASEACCNYYPAPKIEPLFIHEPDTSDRIVEWKCALHTFIKGTPNAQQQTLYYIVASHLPLSCGDVSKRLKNRSSCGGG